MGVRRNRLRELLDDRELLLGAHAVFSDPTFVEFLGLCGYDWLFIDAEHNGFTVETCYTLVRAAQASGMAAVVRVPTSDIHAHVAYAETGADAIMIPHLVSRAQGEELVAALRFPPVGVRGVSTATRAATYGIGHTARRYLEDVNDTVVVAGMIEDADAIADIDPIVRESGVELFSLGLSDLAASLGLPGQTDHVEVRSAYECAVATFRAAGALYIAPAADAVAALAARREGARMLLASTPRLIASELAAFSKQAREGVSALG